MVNEEQFSCSNGSRGARRGIAESSCYDFNPHEKKSSLSSGNLSGHLFFIAKRTKIKCIIKGKAYKLVYCKLLQQIKPQTSVAILINALKDQRNDCLQTICIYWTRSVCFTMKWRYWLYKRDVITLMKTRERFKFYLFLNIILTMHEEC